ncbi:MAG: M48 family metalloprotease [Candidatus Sericytochromatia bacterium]
MKLTLRKGLLAALTLTMLAGTTACSREEIINRGIGAAIGAGVGLIQAQTITPEVENQLGAEVRKQILTEYKIYTDSSKLKQYIEATGQKLAARATRKNEVNFRFDIVESPEINAFAIPGGSIFVTTELLKYLKNEAELAAVLGHEIGHVEDKHTQESLRRAMIAQGIVQGGLQDSQVLAAVGSVAADLILRGFSREQEKEADRTGVRFATQTSYDENGMTGFLQTLRDVSGDVPSGLMRILLTHPGLEERIGLIRQYINEQNIDVNNPVLNAQEYQSQVAVLPPKRTQAAR